MTGELMEQPYNEGPAKQSGCDFIDGLAPDSILPLGSVQYCFQLSSETSDRFAIIILLRSRFLRFDMELIGCLGRNVFRQMQAHLSW